MKPAIESISIKTKRLLFIDANPLIALYEKNKNSEKAKTGFHSIERLGFECIILWPIIFEVRKRLSELNLRDARDFANKFCPHDENAKVPFKLTIEMPVKDFIYFAQEVVNDLNEGHSKPIVSDEDALLAKYALENKTEIFTLDERSFRILETYFRQKLIWDGIYEND